MKKILCLLFAAALVLATGTAAGADLANIDGTLHYFDYYGREAPAIGVDVSFYNNQADWEALKTQGISFAIIRLGGRGWGTGRMYGDRQTQVFLRGARDAGLKVGAYFYSTAVNPTEAVEEARSAIAVLNGFSLDLPLYIDMEYSGDYPDGRSDTLSPGTRAEIASAFCAAVEEAGYRSGIYAGQGYFKYDLDTASISYLPVWLASYTVDNQLPNYQGAYQLWQFTDSGYLGGIDGPVDLSVVPAGNE